MKRVKFYPRLTELSLLGHALPVSIPEDGYPETIAAADGIGFVVAMLNWSDEARTIALDLAELGLDRNKEYTLNDVWTGSTIGTCRGSLLSVRQPPHSVRVSLIGKQY